MILDLVFKPPSMAGLRKFLILFFFFGNILLVTYLWFVNSNFYIYTPAPGNLYIAFGRIFGLWAELFLLTELMLIGRITWFENLFGFDTLNTIHRWIGYSIFSLFIAHPLFLTMGYAAQSGTSFLAQFMDFIQNRDGVLLAAIAVLIFLYVIFISAFVRKRIHYETWYFSHLFTYAAIGLALPHQLGTADLIGGWPLYYWYVLNFAVFGLVLLYRFLRPLARFAYHRFTVRSVVREAPGITSVYITGRHMDRFRFQAGQYANINLLARGMWYTHPFSFSSAYNGEFIRVTIKEVGGYTAKIAEVRPGTRVIIDGPLGLFVEARSKRDKYLFLAGGIGITPLRSMIESLAKERKDIVLMATAKTADGFVFRDEIARLQEIDPFIKVHLIVSTPAPGYETGRVDKEKIVRLVPDFFSREVFLCGPPPMMQSVVENLAEIGFNAKNIHFENFAF
ncbi:MAG: ferredoxin reductase family protein [Candidatus Pacebacteria bacterium]|nr:ferredoxin reductase family protein [Candidatus Paceibacterota bacterium]